MKTEFKPTPEQTKRDELFYSLVSTWKRAYMTTIGNVIGYRARLNELTTWDKSGNNERERKAKITALMLLID